MRRAPRSTLFPYTTLFRSRGRRWSQRRLPPVPGSVLRLRRRQLTPCSSLSPNSLTNKPDHVLDRKSTRLNSSHSQISYAVFCLKKKTERITQIKHSHASSD